MNLKDNLRCEMKKVQKCARRGTLILLCFFPFFITDAYFNITISKLIFFVSISIVYFLKCFSNNFFKEKIHIGITASDIYIALFVFVAAFSSLSSDYKISALTGNKGRYMGFIVYVAIFLAYMFIVKFYKLKEKDMMLFSISVAVMCLFGVIQFIGFNPLGLFNGVPEINRKTFIAFIGNINVYSAYLSIGVPFAMVMFCFSKEFLKKIFWLSMVTIGTIGLFISNSDCCYLGFFTAIYCVFYFVINKKESLKNYIVMLIAMCIVAVSFKLLHNIFIKKSRHLTMLTKVVTDFKIILILMCLLIVFLFWVNRFNVNGKTLLKLKNTVIVLSVLLCIAILTLILWFSIVDQNIYLGNFEHYFRFNDNWGSDRGYVWKKTIEIFYDSPLHKKLIGTGPDTLAIELFQRYKDNMIEVMGFNFDNAHNELLQYLVTIGLFGVFTYLMFIYLSVKECLKSNSIIKKSLVVSVIAYFVQSIVNIHQPIVTPLFFVLLALCNANINNDKKLILAREEIVEV